MATATVLLLGTAHLGCGDVCTDAEAICQEELGERYEPPEEGAACTSTYECASMCIVHLDACDTIESLECQNDC